MYNYLLKKKNQKGFTIVELVIVIAVIAILAAVLIPTFSNVIEKANKSAALQNATNTYKSMMIAGATEGLTFDDVYFASGSGNNTYYFKLTDGTLEESTAPGTGYYPTYYNDVTVYSNGVGVTIGSVPSGATLEIGPAAYYVGERLKTLVYINVPATAGRIVISDSNGKTVYDQATSTSGRIYFSMYYKYTGTNPYERTEAAVVAAGDATTITTLEAAIGWYSYKLTVGTTTYTGVFEYTGK